MPKKLRTRANSKGQEATATPPVFLHSSWRTSSTWLWLRFRNVASTCSYYEIFNERLSSLNKDEALTIGPDSWSSRHPQSAPYFLEFAPLLRSTEGIEGHHPSMAIESFIPRDGLDGHLLDQEATYVDLLIKHARDIHKQPVLTDTRTLGRLSALKRRFGGVHIFLYRNLLHQWASYTSIGFGGDLTFLNSIRLIVNACQHDPFIQSLARLYPLDAPDYRSETYFTVFLLLHLYLYTYAFGHAEISIDMTKLAADADYRKNIRKSVYQQTSLSIDLDGARSTFEMHLIALDDPLAFRERLMAAVQEFYAILHPKKKKIRQIDRVIDDLFEEIDRHKFFTRKITSVVCQAGGLLPQREGLFTQISALQSEHRAVLGQRDELSAERDVLILDRDRTCAELVATKACLTEAQLGAERLTADRESEANQRKHCEAELVAEQEKSAKIIQRLDALSVVHAALIEEREICQRNLDTISRDRDHLESENERLKRDFVALRSEYDKLSAREKVDNGRADLVESQRISSIPDRDRLELSEWRRLLRNLFSVSDSQKDRR